METIILKDNGIAGASTVFFDLDHTIFSVVSGKAIALMALKKGILSPSDLLKALYISFVHRLRILDPLKTAEAMVKWTKGLPEESLNDICYETFIKVLLPSVYSQARSEIEFHKINNRRIVILSASLMPVCEKTAATLGLDDILCTRLEVRSGYLTGRTIGRLCYGEEKVSRLKEYCDNNNINLQKICYYGDSVSDLPVFEAVGTPLCINPDNRLRKTAEKRGWTILRWSR